MPDKPSSKCYILAGGGTGGHLYPGLAVAQKLLEIEPQAKLVFACSGRPIDRKILDPLPYAIVPQPVRPIPRGAKGWWTFFRAYLQSKKLARTLLVDLKPAAVLGLGGFAAGPVVVAAAKAGLPTALINPDAVPGKANQLLARHADVIFTQFEATKAAFAASVQEKVRCVGCPIRPAFFAATREEAVGFFGLAPQLRTLLVFGGSLLAESVSEAVEAMAGDLGPLKDRWQVLHISSSAKAPQIEAKLAAAGVRVKTLKYCERMELAYAAADLVLGRSGAGTIAELAATGRPSILLPYPHHKDQHQKLNAAPLAHAGTAVIVEDRKEAGLNAQSLREQMLPVMRDLAALEKMRQAGANLGKPNAAQTVAQWLAGAGR